MERIAETDHTCRVPSDRGWLPEHPIASRIVPGAAYQIQFSANLADWEALAEIVRANGTVNVDTGAATGTRFYRAVATNLSALPNPLQRTTMRSRVP